LLFLLSACVLKPEVSSLLALEGITPQSQQEAQLPTVLSGKISHRENMKLLVLASWKRENFFVWHLSYLSRRLCVFCLIWVFVLFYFWT